MSPILVDGLVPAREPYLLDNDIATDRKQKLYVKNAWATRHFRCGVRWISPLVRRGMHAGGLSIRHPADSTKRLEYFVQKPAGKRPWPTVVFLHGHQEGLRPGGQDFVPWGALDRWAERGYLAVAVFQPGYGRSSGPPDFCGPVSQRAVSAVLDKLVTSGESIKGKVVIEGISRGALVAGLLVQADSSIAGVVLVSGLFDLPRFAAEANTVARKLIVQMMRSEAGGGDQELVARSMLRSSANIRASVLILNGGLDDRTSSAQARLLAIRFSPAEARRVTSSIRGTTIIYPFRYATLS